ncbi:hypothetical protein IH980_02095 [Patescibacteria group bacterium]|nr:hypothetical protein [Patescibacteria group bacterium]
MSEELMERRLLERIYPPELVEAFPSFTAELEGFLERNAGVVVTAETSVAAMHNYARELVSLARTAAVEVEQFLGQEGGRVNELYRLATSPSRAVGEIVPGDPSQVGVLISRKGGEQRLYHKLDLSRGKRGYDFLMLLQRLPKGLDTEPEVHRAGMEVYLPLTDGIEFHVNKSSVRPSALKKTVTILPGDVHHHILPSEAVGHGPARTLIFGAYGFYRAEKVDAEDGYDDRGRIRRFQRIYEYAKLAKG